MRKTVFILFILISQLAYGQNSDSIKKRAIDLQHQGWQTALNKQFEKSIVLLDSSLALDSSRPEPYVLKAESLWTLKRYVEAAETYKKYMAINKPDYSIGSYVLLGMLYDKAKMRREANTEYRNAINTYENSYQPSGIDKTEEVEYVFAFGLLGDKKKWKSKLAELVNKYPFMKDKALEKKTREQLLELHFSPFGG